MDKKILGIKIGTIISFLICILVAFCIWIYAKYTGLTPPEEAVAAETASALQSDIRCYNVL